jgi:hypothetical protein
VWFLSKPNLLWWSSSENQAQVHILNQ